MTPEISMRRLHTSAASLVVALGLACHTAEVEPPVEESTLDNVDEAGRTQIDSADSIFRGGAIGKIQQALGKNGYPVEISHRFDEETEKALMRFQAEKDVPRTGFPDHETLRLLGLEPSELYLPNESKP